MKPSFWDGFFKSALLLGLLVVVTAVAYSRYQNVLSQTRSKLSNQIIAYNIENFVTLGRYLEKELCGDFAANLNADALRRGQLESLMGIAKSSNVEYLYLISRDEAGHYFFVLDSEERPEYHAEVYQPFDPVSPIWDESYDTRSVQLFHHRKFESLWVTVVIPLVREGHVIALLGADISQDLELNVDTELALFGELFFWTGLIGLLWSLALYMLIVYFRRKHELSQYDPLTGAFNRKYLDETLKKHLHGNYQLSMIDADRFKRINDRYGHAVGDEVLQTVVKRLQKNLRPNDKLIRIGGEEFVLVTQELSYDQVYELADRLRRSVEHPPMQIQNRQLHITISIGVNPYANRQPSFEKALVVADKALYRAKAAGRNQVVMAYDSPYSSDPIDV